MSGLPIEKVQRPMFHVHYENERGYRSRNVTRRAYAVRWLAKQMVFAAMLPFMERWQQIEPELIDLVAKRLEETQDAKATEQWVNEQAEAGEFFQYVTGDRE